MKYYCIIPVASSTSEEDINQFVDEFEMYLYGLRSGDEYEVFLIKNPDTCAMGTLVNIGVHIINSQDPNKEKSFGLNLHDDLLTDFEFNKPNKWMFFNQPTFEKLNGFNSTEWWKEDFCDNKLSRIGLNQTYYKINAISKIRNNFTLYDVEQVTSKEIERCIEEASESIWEEEMELVKSHE